MENDTWQQSTCVKHAQTEKGSREAAGLHTSKVNIHPTWSHSSQCEDKPHFLSLSVGVVTGAELDTFASTVNIFLFFAIFCNFFNCINLMVFVQRKHCKFIIFCNFLQFLFIIYLLFALHKIKWKRTSWTEVLRNE